MNIIKLESFASDIRFKKLPLLANKVSAYGYWKILDPEHNGVLDFKTFNYLLKSFEIEGICNEEGWESKETIEKNSSIFTYNKQVYFDNESNSYKENSNMKFDFLENSNSSLPDFRIFEYLFLERCALV